MKPKLIKGLFILLGVLLILCAGYIWTSSKPKETPQTDGYIQNNFNNSNQAQIEFVKKYFEAVKNGDRSSVRNWSVSQMDYSSGDAE